MKKTSYLSHRHHLKGAVVALSAVLGIAAIAAASASFAGRIHRPSALRLSAASTAAPATADRVALGSVDAHDTGPGTARGGGDSRQRVGPEGRVP